MNNSQASARASLYHLLALVFDHPLPELHNSFSTTEFRTALWKIQDALSMTRADLQVTSCDFQQFESDYISTFELGRKGEVACSLQESAHVDISETDFTAEESGGRSALFQRLLRFYHHFGLRITDNPEERVLPDHLSCQLEMLSFLCFRESQVKPGHKSAGPYRRAQRDFLQRHIGKWLPQFVAVLRRRTEQSDVEKFYNTVADIMLTAVNVHKSEYSNFT